MLIAGIGARRWLPRVLAAAASTALLTSACAPTPDPAAEPAAAAEPARAGEVATGGWERLPDGPLSPRMGAGVAALDDDRVVVFGGNSALCPPTADCGGSGDPYFIDGAVFDRAGGTWTSIADLPVEITDPEVATVDGMVHALVQCRRGPMCPSGSTLLRWDSEEDAWEVFPGIPDDGWWHELTTWDGTVVAVADSQEQGEVADHRFDPEADGGDGV